MPGGGIDNYHNQDIFSQYKILLFESVELEGNNCSTQSIKILVLFIFSFSNKNFEKRISKRKSCESSCQI